jgi:hypothetical protein
VGEVIHYHGTPLTPRAELYKLAGRHFCVSFAEPRDADVCMQIGQSVLWDNGAFSAYTQGKELDRRKLFGWIEERLIHPHRAIILDKIDGSVAEQRKMLDLWPFSWSLSWPVWHIDKPLDYLSELAEEWPAVCFGSSGAYWEINSPAWERRMDQAFNHLSKKHARLPWVHGLRMLSQANSRWPLASADSVNVARNYASQNRDPGVMAAEIDSQQPPSRWELRPEQEEMFA